MDQLHIRRTVHLDYSGGGSCRAELAHCYRSDQEERAGSIDSLRTGNSETKFKFKELELIGITFGVSRETRSIGRI